MNIISSVPLNAQSTIQDLHRIYIQAKDQQECKTIHKFKTRIRIKSRSQGRLIYEKQQKNKEEGYKVIKLISLLKEEKDNSTQNTQQKGIAFGQDAKTGTTQRQLLFLKQLINRRKMMVETGQKSKTRSQSENHSQFKQMVENKDDMGLTSQTSTQNNSLSITEKRMHATTHWNKRLEEYKNYDKVVKNLLEEIGSRKSLKKLVKTKVSPNKFYDTKEKFFTKNQGDQPQLGTKISFKNIPRRESMIFRMYDASDSVYEKKLTSYIKFLFKINFSNGIYSDLSLSNPGKTYKVKIGKGNNCELIQMLIKRRFWLETDNSLQPGSTKEENKISFIWTQSTNQNAHNLQQNNTIFCENSNKKDEQIQRNPRKIKRPKKKGKKQESFACSQKILHPFDIEQSELIYNSSLNGGVNTNLSKFQPTIVSNHIPSNFIIGSKKVLFLLLHWYYENILKIDPFTYLPKTYNIKSGDINNFAFLAFLKNEGSSTNSDNIWIIKPGEHTNRGNGITVATFNQVAALIKKKQVHKNGQEKTYIIQKYLKPFLYNSRKFDIRHYLLITSVKGNIKAYWYKEGYIRTSSEKYDLDDLSNEFVHLTNDAIQKKSDLYGKYEPGNKLSYANFQRYLDQNYPNKKYMFENQILTKMKEITTDLIHASFSFLDPTRKNYNFELYGMDFMVDHKFQPYLIQINANPCLQISCPVLQRIIPTLVQHTFRIALDPLFPPPQHFPLSQRYQLSDRILQKLKFQLIFDEKNQGNKIRQKIKECQTKFILPGKQLLQPDEELFQNDGQKLKNLEID